MVCCDQSASHVRIIGMFLAMRWLSPARANTSSLLLELTPRDEFPYKRVLPPNVPDDVIAMFRR
jgi:hypothetical protein